MYFYKTLVLFVLFSFTLFNVSFAKNDLNLEPSHRLLEISDNYKKDYNEIKKLITSGADVNAIDDTGYTPLMKISNSFEDHYDIIKLLLDSGANVNAINSDGRTALITASFNGHTKTVKEMLSRGANPNIGSDDGMRALIQASVQGHEEIVKMLIKADADVHNRHKGGITALNFTAATGRCRRSKIIKILLENKADPDAATDRGLTALMAAASLKPMIEDKSLNTYGFNYGIDDRETFLILGLLIDAGADVNAKTKDTNRTVFDIAKENNRQDIIDFIKQAQKSDISAFKLALSLQQSKTFKAFERGGTLSIISATPAVSSQNMNSTNRFPFPNNPGLLTDRSRKKELQQALKKETKQLRGSLNRTKIKKAFLKQVNAKEITQANKDLQEYTLNPTDGEWSILQAKLKTTVSNFDNFSKSNLWKSIVPFKNQVTMDKILEQLKYELEWTESL